jgi:hypothetical protein
VQPLSDMLLMFPNPTTDRLTIRLKNSIDIITFARIYNTLGQCIIATPIDNARDYHFDVSQLNKGIYVVEVTTSKGTISKRLLIE